MTKIGIQGDIGSACDAIAAHLVNLEESELIYLKNAQNVLVSLKKGAIAYGILALESPVGTLVQETSDALQEYGFVDSVKEFLSEVRHVILVRNSEERANIQFVASHIIPLRKHRKILNEYFPGYKEIETEDSGVAAAKLASGELPDNCAAIAMPNAADIYNLKILDLDLPANDKYLTKFALVR